MSTQGQTAARRSALAGSTRCWSVTRLALLLFMAVAAVTTPGCTCRQETPEEQAAREALEEEEAKKRKAEREKKQKKPPLEVQPPIPQPGPDDILSLYVKPGHWQIAKQAMKPNYENWVGEATLQVVDGQNQPIPMDRTGFAVRGSRDVALAKGEEKQIESVVYIPPAPGQLKTRSTLRQRGASLAQPPQNLKLTRMAPHQQHLVVLSKEPARYQFLKTMYSIDAPLIEDFEDYSEAGRMTFSAQYRLVAPSIEKRIPLPDNPLCWTSVAYLLWDEVEPERLSKAQQAALVDWLHWGGQLVVSGPDSLDLLRDSFFDPYLPADSGGARNLTADDLATISRSWAASRRRKPIEPVAAWSGIQLKLREEAEPVAGVKDLFAERRVGRGRVIVSAMQLAERGLVNWQDGHENLMNNLLLRRPPRRFGWSSPTYIGAEDDVAGSLYVARSTKAGALIDGGANTKLRFFARDTHAEPDAFGYRVVATETAQPANNFGSMFPQQTGSVDTRRFAEPAAAAGPAAWSDFSAAATAARGALREAAGVDVPGARFVVICLAVYLAVLAPFNWFFFKALGRVELAWVAAPIIALLGTYVVVRQAQLDIGFVRAQNEVAILETQPGHPRGHLTRYLSFYTSLSTTYDLEFDGPTALAAPFARSDQPALLEGQRPAIVTYQRQEKARLLGLSVSSNSTDMAHTEEMVDLGGALTLDPRRNRLTNETDHALESLVVVRRPVDDGAADPTLLGCWVGDLDRRSSTPLSFQPLSWAEGTSPFADRRIPAVAASADGSAGGETDAPLRLNLEPLFALALDPTQLEPGEVRAVALLDEVFPGVSVAPAASQLRGVTFVVAHLRYAPLPTPKADANAPVDVERRR
ncbi:MAG: hypothetical protein AAGB00_01755 [Planctomycetota bacterium]